MLLMVKLFSVNQDVVLVLKDIVLLVHLDMSMIQVQLIVNNVMLVVHLVVQQTQKLVQLASMAIIYQEQVAQNVMLHVKNAVELLQVVKVVFLESIMMVLHVSNVLEIVKYVQLLEYVHNAEEDSLLLPIILAEVAQDHVQVALLMISQHAHHVLDIFN